MNGMLFCPPTTTVRPRVPPSGAVAPIFTSRTLPGHLSKGISIGIFSTPVSYLILAVFHPGSITPLDEEIPGVLPFGSDSQVFQVLGALGG
jgi:hypothetical protein